MRMSGRLAKRWSALRLDDALPGVVLQPKLREIVEAPLVFRLGGVFLKPLLESTPGRPDQLMKVTLDITGYEAYVNKMHIEDFITTPGNAKQERLRVLLTQGARAAIDLSKRLAREGKFRVLMGLDSNSLAVTLRFYSLREGVSWGPDDPDEIPRAELLMIDTENQQ